MSFGCLRKKEGYMNTMPWNQRLRQERIQRNWRQQEVAEKLGTTVLTVSRWERASHQPSAYFRVKLCALFGKRAQELGLEQDPAGTGDEHQASVWSNQDQA